MSGGAWPFLVGGATCLVNSVNERDLHLLNRLTPYLFRFMDRHGAEFLLSLKGSGLVQVIPNLGTWGARLGRGVQKVMAV